MPEIQALRRHYEESVMRLVALAREVPEFTEAADAVAVRLTADLNERIIIRNKESLLLDRLVTGLAAGEEAHILIAEVKEARRHGAMAVRITRNALAEASHALVAAILDHGDNTLFAAALAAGQARITLDDAYLARDRDLSGDPADLDVGPL